MQSYSYKDGIWETIIDPLPRISSSRSAEFRQALAEEGFNVSSSASFACKLLQGATVYARDPIRSSSIPRSYGFLCVLSLGGFSYRVWVCDLPNVLRFLQELEAAPEARDTEKLETVKLPQQQREKTT